MRLSPETFPTIQGHEIETADAIDATSDWIKLSNCNGVLITVMYYHVGDLDMVLTVHESADGTGTTAIATEFPIWANVDTSVSDALVRQTDAVTYTIDTTAGKNQIVQFYIPASILTTGNKWIQLDTSGGHATSYAAVLYQLDGVRYQEDGAPTAIA